MALADIPFLGAYLEQQRLNQQRPMAELKQVAGVMELTGAMQRQAKERQAQAELAALGPNPSQEALAGWAAKYSSPESVLKTQQASLDRQAQMGATMEAARGRLAQQAQYADMMHQWRMAQAKTAEERAAEQVRHNQVMEKHAAERANLDAEIRRLGLQLHSDRLTMDRDRRLEGDVTALSNELQQNKLPNLSASITSLNNVLKKYEGKQDIPGVGVVEGAKWIPGFLRTREGANVRSSLQAVSNDLLNLYSGLAVTLPESERRELEMMANGEFTEGNFKDAWQRTVNRYNTVVGNLRAGQHEDVLRLYRSRSGAMALDPLAPAFANEALLAQPQGGANNDPLGIR